MTTDTTTDALAILAYAADPANTNGEQCPVIGTRALHQKHPLFKRGTKDRINQAFEKLEFIGAASEPILEKSKGGRPFETRRINSQYLPSGDKTMADVEADVLTELMKTSLAAVKKQAGSLFTEAPPVVVALVESRAVPVFVDNTPSLRFLRDTQVIFNGSFTNYKAGAVVSDWHLKQNLLAHKYAVVPVDDVNACNCPRCSVFFDVTFDDGAQHDPVMIVLANSNYPFHGSLIPLKRGDLLQDFHLVANLLAYPIPNVVLAGPADFARCPGCKHIFLHGAAMGSSYRRPA